MSAFRTAIIASATLLAATGLTGTAMAQINKSHILTVQLPDGSVEQIRYQGDQPPQVRVNPYREPVEMIAPFFDPFDTGSPFADLERISAAMDRETAAMLREARGLEGAAWGRPDGLTSVNLGSLPAAASGYSMVSTVSGDGVCSRSVQYFAAGNGKPARVVTHTSGHCGASQAGQAAHAVEPRPAERIQRPHLIEASYKPANPQK